MTERLQQALRRVLREDIGADPEARVIVAATLRAQQRISRQVAPLIGETAATAIEARSLQSAGAAFPWFADIADDDVGLLPAGRPRALYQEPSAPMEAAVSVLAAFVELLASFIGESPTIRLLQQTWPEGHFDGALENLPQE